MTEMACVTPWCLVSTGHPVAAFAIFKDDHALYATADLPASVLYANMVSADSELINGRPVVYAASPDQACKDLVHELGELGAYVTWPPASIVALTPR